MRLARGSDGGLKDLPSDSGESGASVQPDESAFLVRDRRFEFRMIVDQGQDVGDVLCALRSSARRVPGRRELRDEQILDPQDA